MVFAGTDVGLTAISLAVLLLLLFPEYSKNLARNISWNAVVVISGLLVFIGTMMSVHTMDALENRLLGMTTNHVKNPHFTGVLAYFPFRKHAF